MPHDAQREAAGPVDEESSHAGRSGAAPEQLRPHVDNITDYAIYMLDPRGHVASWNAGARHIKGYEAEEIIGRHFSVFYVPDGTAKAVTQALLDEALHQGHATHEGWRLRKSGEKFWASVVITSVFDKGRLIGFSKVTRDLTERKLAEDQLRLSEERYRLLVDGVREYAIFALDPSGRITSWNAGAERTKGYAASEIIGKHFSTFYPVMEIAAGAPQRELEIAAQVGRHECEGWRLRKDGRRFWAHVVLTAIYDAERLLGFCKVTRDVSDQRRTEEALRQSEERYRLLVAGVSDYAILALDREGTIVSWNAGAERIKGWVEHEIVGRHFSTFYPPSDVAACKPQRELEIASATGRFEEEGQRVRKDGTRFWAHVVITAMREGDRVVGFSKVTRDITERRRVEASLTTTRHLLEASHSMSKLGGWELDLLTDEMVWTDGTYAIHEVDPSTYRPSLASWLSFFAPEAIAELGSALQRATQRGEDFSLELRSVGPTGRDGWVHVTSRVVVDAGRPVRIAGAIQDVTSRKLAELSVRDLNATLENRVRERTETIHRMNDQLQASERALKERAEQLAEARDAAVAATQVKSSLLANLSHEIRTPLAGVIGLADVLATTPLSGEQRELVRLLRASGAGLLEVLNDMLDFSKLEAGEIKPEASAFHLGDCLEEAVDVFAVEAAGKGIDLALAVHEDVPALLVSDARRLKQIVVNLVSNAVKFTARGEVVVTASLDRSSPPQLAIAVRDTGIGIASDRGDRIYQPFVQADESTSREAGGTGLGLSLCRTLAKLLGGDLSHESALGQGSVFSVRIPLVASGKGDVVPDRVRLHGRHVLVVQRPETSRDVLVQRLSRWGAKVTVVPHEDALPGVEADVDLCLLDADSATHDRAATLRAGVSPGAVPCPVVLLRWRGPPGLRDTHCVAVVWKPVRLAPLRHAIERAIGSLLAPPPEPAATSAPRSLRVLVVEDNKTNRIVIAHQLEKLGHAAVFVGDGESALAHLAEHVCDVVLMDVHMPGIDGLETTRRARARFGPAAQPRIIAVTANALEGDREHCLAAGMDDYLAKPVTLGDLDAALRRSPRSPAAFGGALADASGEAEAPRTSSAPFGDRQPDEGDAGEPISSAVDATVLEELRRLGEDTGTPLVAQLAAAFLEDVPRDLAALDQKVAAGDTHGGAELAHKIRSGCITLGATEMARALLSLENAVVSGERTACPALFLLVLERFAAVRVLLSPLVVPASPPTTAQAETTPCA